MKNHIKYTFSKMPIYFEIFATILGVIAVFPLGRSEAIITIIIVVTLSFVVPFLMSFFKRTFRIRTIGKSNITFKFGDIFDEECFVVTTTRYFDVNPTGEYISENSLIGRFVKKYFPRNPEKLEKMIKEELRKKGKKEFPVEYGDHIKIDVAGKIVYLLAFTDRKKSNQPDDFYIQAVQPFLKSLADENHGKTICFPLLGDNNNLSNSGFENSEVSFRSLLAMINNFEIINQRSGLKLKIVALPEKRSELIKAVSFYSK